MIIIINLNDGVITWEIKGQVIERMISEHSSDGRGGTCRIQIREGGQFDYSIGRNSWADKQARIGTGEAASFPGDSESPVKKNPPDSEGGRGTDRVTFEECGKLCSSC